MREDLLHFIWKYKKLQLADLLTSQNEHLNILDIGTHNHLSGPDFFYAKVIIGEQLWAGNIEIHIKSSDWYAHHHEEDENYNNVILHVVWEDDLKVYRKDMTVMPTLVLKKYIPKDLLLKYQMLFDKKQTTFINCEKSIAKINGFVFDNWLERIYIERLEQKSVLVFEQLSTSKNDWEKVVFSLLLKSFGLKINGDSFLGLGNAIDFSVVKKIKNNVLQLESTLFGLAGLLDDESIVDTYYLKLTEEYNYLKHKFNLSEESVQKPEFFKLRPPNFPTIRLSQFANLYAEHQGLFRKLLEASNLDRIYSIFNVSASSYWDNHFSFGKESKRSRKKLTKKFIDLLIINTILPIKYCYAKHHGTETNEVIFNIVENIKNEDNSIIGNFIQHGVKINNAKESQAILELYNHYCTKNKCLQCAVGSSLLNGNI